jgi:hypothetical protein
MNLSPHTVSPLTSVLERFANLEKTIGHMLAVNEYELYSFISSDTPLAKLLAEDIPAVANAKKDLDALMRRQDSSQTALEKEKKKLEKMNCAAEEDVDEDSRAAQQVGKCELKTNLYFADKMNGNILLMRKADILCLPLRLLAHSFVKKFVTNRSDSQIFR